MLMRTVVYNARVRAPREAVAVNFAQFVADDNDGYGNAGHYGSRTDPARIRYGFRMDLVRISYGSRTDSVRTSYPRKPARDPPQPPKPARDPQRASDAVCAASYGSSTCASCTLHFLLLLPSSGVEAHAPRLAAILASLARANDNNINIRL